VDSLKGLGKQCLWISIAVMLGCDPAVCSRECPEGSHCVSSKNNDICVWGKLDPETNLTVPDIRLALEEGILTPNRRTNNAALQIRVRIYGAPLRAEDSFKNSRAEPLSSPCTEQTAEFGGERREWLCTPQTKEDGKYYLSLWGQGIHGTTEEVFDWTYDATAPKAHITVTSQSEWGRDDAFPVEVASDEDTAWEKSSLRVGNLSLAYMPCPSAKAHTRCVDVPLSELPLPHGSYELKLEAHLVDEVGNKVPQHEAYSLNISRKQWYHQKPGIASANPLFATREGGVVVHLNGDISILDARSKGEATSISLRRPPPQQAGPHYEGPEPMVLGNHRGRSVLVTTCITPEGTNGLQAIQVPSGIEESHCSGASDNTYTQALAILQGGPGQDLVVARSIANGSAGSLQVCRLNDKQFYCPLRQENFFTSGALVVHSQHADISIYAASPNNAWLAFSVTQARPSSALSTEIRPVFGAGKRRLLGENWQAPQYDLYNMLRKLPWELTPLAIDTDDGLIASSPHSQTGWRVQRYMLEGNFVAQTSKPLNWFPKEGFLLEGGDLLLAGEDGSVALLNSELDVVWRGDRMLGAGLQLKQATLVPLSEKRSMLVLQMQQNGSGIIHGGILVDAPGLKQDAPWPMRGHDMCQSFNSGVAADNCWEGTFFTVSPL